MTATDFIHLWLRAFTLTVLVEAPIAASLLRATRATLGRRVAAVVFANLSSHPLLWFVLSALPLSHHASLAVSEAWAVACEAALYALVFEPTTARRALGVSLAANAASLAVGLTVRTLAHSV